MRAEGVIKFHSRHQRRALAPRDYGDAACVLIAWREIMARTGLVGQDPARYDGAGYGNVSCRVGAPSSPPGARRFLISGTQTGGRRCVSLADFCVVERYDYRRNRVDSFGDIEPSSESMTHGAIYDLSPRIRYVLHAHTPIIWRRAAALRIPTSDPGVAYGTPEMAREVRRLFRATHLSDARILAMGGHEDGVIVFGHTADEAGQALLSHLARAYASACADADHALCDVP
jgi:ribulose-5-phosphate 4-epimerase/fuculose-1-phosphate aldolase